MSKLIGIASSDWHLHPFQAFSKGKYGRFHIALEVARYIFQVSYEAGVPTYFSGDLLHDPQNIHNYVLKHLIKFFKETYERYKIPFIAISGNHDQSEANTGENVSPSYLQPLSEVFDYFHLIDRDSFEMLDPKGGRTTYTWGVPYMKDDKALIKMIKQANKEAKKFKGTKILLLHTDLPNCPNPQGFVVKEVKGIPQMMDTLWNNFDHVLGGHIHKPHKASDIAVMLGSPIHQNEGDTGCTMGYWEIYTDKKVFVPLNQFPKFVKAQSHEEVAIDQYHSEGHYVIIEDEDLPEKGTEVKELEFSNTLSVKKLTTRYLKKTSEQDPAKKALLLDLLTTAKND